MNRAVAARMETIFTRRNIPVVPSLGTSWLNLESYFLNYVIQVTTIFGVSLRAIFETSY